MPAGEQADQQLLDDGRLTDDDFRELFVNPSPRSAKLLDRLLLQHEFVELRFHVGDSFL
jgi:hypothetical protein